MKKFDFRLQSVLRFRALQAEQERIKLKGLMGERERLEKALAATRDERSTASTFLCGLDRSGSADLKALASYTLAIQARAMAIEEEITRNRDLITSQTQRLVDAERNELLLAKLRERKLQEWRHESDRELETLSEEFWRAANSTRWTRK